MDSRAGSSTLRNDNSVIIRELPLDRSTLNTRLILSLVFPSWLVTLLTWFVFVTCCDMLPTREVLWPADNSWRVVTCCLRVTFCDMLPMWRVVTCCLNVTCCDTLPSRVLWRVPQVPGFSESANDGRDSFLSFEDLDDGRDLDETRSGSTRSSQDLIRRHWVPDAQLNNYFGIPVVLRPYTLHPSLSREFIN